MIEVTNTSSTRGNRGRQIETLARRKRRCTFAYSEGECRREISERSTPSVTFLRNTFFFFLRGHSSTFSMHLLSYRYAYIYFLRTTYAHNNVVSFCEYFFFLDILLIFRVGVFFLRDFMID